MSAVKPVSIFVGALGLGMAVLAITFVRLQLGAAPPEEPISGRFGHLPTIEALFPGGLWGVEAVGALLFVIALWTDRLHLLRPAVWAWVVGGVVFLLFGAMNFCTHIGMYYNVARTTTSPTAPRPSGDSRDAMTTPTSGTRAPVPPGLSLMSGPLLPALVG